MITWNVSRGPIYEEDYMEGACLSTDTKPTDDKILNGSKLLEMDTSTLYIYDAKNKVWRAWS